MNGVYVPVDIDELSDDVLQGYSPALNLLLRWERGELAFYDPATERHIVTFDELQERVDQERAARLRAEARADHERAARMQAEARIRQLEAQLSQQDG